ncbi:MAG: transposase [Myxococcota bacterium]
MFPTLVRSIADTNAHWQDRFRICEFSAQPDHVHMIVEADDQAALVDGMRGFEIRTSRRMNRLLMERGGFFADRWHGRALTSPRNTRNAIVYVLANHAKHSGERPCASVDRYSSAPYFRDFIEFRGRAPYETSADLLGAEYDAEEILSRESCDRTLLPVARARTWLLSIGWKRHGLISILERPHS